MRRCSPFVAVALAIVAAGCGGSGSGGRGGSGSGPPGNGKTLFTQACGACHTVSGVDSPKHQGGDLLAVHMSRAALLQFAREMPVRRRLTSAELATVADYILAVQRRRGA
jgi:mono/diheme cytochrome c family protein